MQHSIEIMQQALPSGSLGPRGGGCTQAECVRELKGLALLHASHYSKIALSDSQRLCSTLAAALVLFKHAAVTEAKTRISTTPTVVLRQQQFDHRCRRKLPIE